MYTNLSGPVSVHTSMASQLHATPWLPVPEEQSPCHLGPHLGEHHPRLITMVRRAVASFRKLWPGASTSQHWASACGRNLQTCSCFVSPVFCTQNRSGSGILHQPVLWDPRVVEWWLFGEKITTQERGCIGRGQHRSKRKSEVKGQHFPFWTAQLYDFPAKVLGNHVLTTTQKPPNPLHFKRSCTSSSHVKNLCFLHFSYECNKIKTVAH